MLSSATRMAQLPRLGIIASCFFVSGATALVYQVVWMRMLGLVFGHTVYAITTVLAAFMAGLGLGSFVFGRWGGRFRHPVRTYGIIEIGVGIYCALTPALFGLASVAYLGLHHTLVSSYEAFSFVQFVLVFALLLPPTMLMGGTLPVLTRAVVGPDTGVGRRVGALYAINTIGGVTGVVLAGYILLPETGNRSTLAVAAVSNVAVGIVAILYSRTLATLGRAAAGRGRRRREPAVTPAGPPATTLDAALLAVALGFSGAVSMIYEVAWTRALTLVIGSSTYAFTAMLLAVLVGIAVGAGVYSYLWGARRANLEAFAVIQMAIGLGVAAVLLAFERTPVLFLAALRWSDVPAFVQAVQVVVSVIVFLVPAVLIGTTFPCALAGCAPTAARAGADTGRLYAVNTLGAIGGVVLAGFVLVPAHGVHAAIKVGIITNFAVAALLLVARFRAIPRGRWTLAVTSLVVVGAAVLFIPGWSPQVMSSGPAIYAPAHLTRAKGGALAPMLQEGTVLFYRDGPSATVAVTRWTDGQRSLKVNGKADASTDLTDMTTQLLIGHLPMLLHRDPRQVLVIGLGSGVTAGAVARHPVEHLDIVEIEPRVVEASSFFARENRDVLKDPRARLVMADARNFLLTTPQRYDVIASEPSNPWIGGVASLFSLEFFQLARAHLRPGGLMAQWVQSYGLVPEDLGMIVRTFRAVFPDTSVWQLGPADYLLVGKTRPSLVDLRLVRGRWEALAGLRQDLQHIGVPHWAGVLGYFMLGETDVAQLPGALGLNTDDRLRLEFSTSRSLFLDTSATNYSMMRQLRTTLLPDLERDDRHEIDRAEARYAIGLVCWSQTRWRDALSHFRRALELDPDYTPAIVKSGDAALRLGQPSVALGFAQHVLRREPRNADALLVAGLASLKLNDAPGARAFLQQANTARPNDEEIQQALRNVMTP